MTSNLLAASRIPFWWRRFILCHTSRSGNSIYSIVAFQPTSDRIIASAPRAGGNSRDEGSLLGGLGSLLETDDFKFNKRFKKLFF
jgi:hypothetical protein